LAWNDPSAIGTGVMQLQNESLLSGWRRSWR